MSKVKVLKLDWYCNFRNGLHLWVRTGRVKTKNNDAKILEEEIKLKKECKKYGDYDGPLLYLEELVNGDPTCDNLPKKEGIKYCIRLTDTDRIECEAAGDKIKHNSEDYYWCYTYQIGKWWKYKGPQYLFYDLYIPLFDREDYHRIRKSKILKYLDKKYYKSFIWWKDTIEIINTGRQSSFWSRKTLNKVKSKIKKK